MQDYILKKTDIWRVHVLTSMEMTFVIPEIREQLNLIWEYNI